MNCDDNFALYAVSIDAADAATCKQPSNQSADWPAGRLFGPLEHVVERWVAKANSDWEGHQLFLC